MTKTSGTGILVDVLHQVPAIRWDARAGRERLAILVGRTQAVLRTIPSGSFETRLSSGRSWSPDGVEALPDEHWFEGRAWARQEAPALDAVRRAFSQDGIFRRHRGLGFADLLTRRVGAGRVDDPEPPGIRERYDAEASAYVRAMLATDFGYDGSWVWSAACPAPGGKGPLPHTDLLTAMYALMVAADIPGIDPETEDRSAPVRRLVARDAVGAVEAHELPDAYRAVLRLCERLVERRHRGSRAATARMWVRQMEDRIAALRPEPLPSEDAEVLAGLAG